MIKKFLSMVAIAGMVFTTSCSSDEFEPAQTGEEAVVSFTAELPGDLESRVFGDGLKANTLSYFVYDEGWSYLGALSKVNEEMPGLTTTVNLQLVNGKKYHVVFWADNEDAPYSFTNDYKEVAMNYAAANDENRDAFYKVIDVTVNGNATHKVELTRPFAQINIGTSDWQAVCDNGINISATGITVNAYQSLDLTTGEANGAATTTTFTPALMPADTETFPVTGDYKYLSMNYILAQSDKELVEVTINYDGGVQPRTFTGVPVQRNYRTNIYGKLLTSDQGFNVEILPAFNEPDFNEYAWNGQMTEPEAYDEATKTYNIYKPEELAWIAALVNGTLPDDSRANLPADALKGKTVKLMNDISLGGLEWTPIGTSANQFKGTFDGQGYTISNLKVSGNKSNVGLFGLTTEGEIKNLTVENAEVSGYLNVGVVAGQPYTSKYTNITVKGLVKVNGFAYVGGVGGKNAYNDWTDVTVDVVEGSYVNAQSENYRTYVGGVVGFNGEGGHTFKNIKSNINVTGSTCDVGGVFGIAHEGNSIVNAACTGNVEITSASVKAEAQEIGGIAGVWHNGGRTVTFTNCSFTGNLITNIAIDSSLFTNLVCAAYNANGTGKLNIDGVEYMQTSNGVSIDGNYVVANHEALINVLNSGNSVLFNNDIEIPAASESNSYGKTGINVKNGQTIDGAGYELNTKGANSTWDSGISTTGGLIKNLTVTGSFRGIFVNHNSDKSSKVVLENVVVDGPVYTISCDQGTNNGLEATNCTFNGWTSYAATLGEAKFVSCSFGLGSGYKFARPYAQTSFVNCDFCEGYKIDARAAVTFENCTINGVALTAENLSTLVTSNIANATVK